ncbi:hypothetical protein L3X07_14160 [Levilactobacillus brevis]|nr:hypothetical protein [Levilactobacillus brevis]
MRRVKRYSWQILKRLGQIRTATSRKDFAESCAAIVYDSEQVNTSTVKFLAQYTQIPQGTDMLEMMQDRLLERAFFEQLNVNIAPMRRSSIWMTFINQ